ncbi:MAG: hypothetical protein NTW19_18595 [Planctomycetota bacterium]|nr:hypothetical protein [Planctomycetota bacterium]
MIVCVVAAVLYDLRWIRVIDVGGLELFFYVAGGALVPLIAWTLGMVVRDMLGEAGSGTAGGTFHPTLLICTASVAVIAGRCFQLGWRRTRLRRDRAREIRRQSGCCASCGYDLRASIGQCPECGCVIELAREKV